MIKMADLTEIITGDLRLASSKMALWAREFGIGALHGAYTPFLLTTGVKHAKQSFRNDHIPDWLQTGYIDWLGQVSGSLGTQMPLAFVAFSEGKGPAYLGALAATNIADYLVHTYRRSKQTEE